MTDDQFFAWLARQGKPDTKALRSYQYGDPAGFIRFDRERGGDMRHLIRSEKADEAFVTKAPMDKILDIWADFLTLKDSQISAGLANPQDVKDFVRIGEAVEVMVNDLRRHQWWAVRKSRGICTAWIFKDEYYEGHLTQAREILEKKMRTHIATSRFFR